MGTTNVTLNPNDMNGSWGLFNGNLTAIGIGGTSGNIRATHGKTEGKWYWEVKFNEGHAGLMIGVANKNYPITTAEYTGTSGVVLNIRGYNASQSFKHPEGITYGSTWTIGDVIGVALDMDNGTLEFYKNGVSMGVSHTNLIGLGEIFPFFKDLSVSSNTFTVNFGATPFSYPMPIGYQAFGYQLLDKILIKTDGVYVYYDTVNSQWTPIGSSPTEQDYLTYGISDLSIIPESAWQELTGEVELAYYTDNTSINEAQFSIETEPFTLADELGSTFSVIEYTDNPTQEESVILTETEPYSVYDFISETPEVLVYTELTDDVIVETTTEPFDIYDEFGDSVDILYYTDDTAVTEADLILEANWSPIDELDGDFEVVTWTDESSDTAQRTLEMTAIPKPQFIKLVNPKRLYGFLEDIIVNDISMSYRDEARYFFADTDTTKWYIYDTSTKSFVLADTSTHEAILQNGMKFDEVNALEYEDWSIWGKDWLNIGIFLKDNPRDTITSIVDNMTFKDFLPRHSTTTKNASFYILNTTAKIDLELKGNTIEGILSDDDLTRVQYRVSLNGEPYYPADGSFTKLEAPPKNINITISSHDIKINEPNYVKVEFQDFFGTTDYWQASFIGTYSGLMFKDISGNYYSNEIGEVLQYLDFGIIIAGQTTVEHEIVLKNQYGYDVENVRLDVNTSNFPQGMVAELSKSLAPFVPESHLELGSMANGDEVSFFIRLKTELGVTPDANGEFDIIVRADRVAST